MKNWEMIEDPFECTKKGDIVSIVRLYDSQEGYLNDIKNTLFSRVVAGNDLGYIANENDELGYIRYYHPIFETAVIYRRKVDAYGSFITSNPYKVSISNDLQFTSNSGSSHWEYIFDNTLDPPKRNLPLNKHYSKPLPIP